MQIYQEFARIHQHQKPYYPQEPQQKQYLGRGRNTLQQQPQFGENLSHHHQGWLWQSGAENVEQVNVKNFLWHKTDPHPQK